MTKIITFVLLLIESLDNAVKRNKIVSIQHTKTSATTTQVLIAHQINLEIQEHSDTGYVLVMKNYAARINF